MPSPSDALVVREHEPFNAETSLPRLRASYVTAQRDLYVRSHGPVPALEEATHRLRVDGLVAVPLDLSMPELKRRFAHHTVRATVQCAGNRRADMLAVRPVSGQPWSAGAIGTADWTGARLGDVLRAAGVDAAAALHVHLAALDECETDGERYRYEASIPLAKAMAPEVLLCWAANGEALEPRHGFPLRVVVPGYAGARGPKWLHAVTVSDRPSEAKPQARDYKLFPPDVRKDTVDWNAGVTINEMPVNSAICEPAALARLAPGRVVVRGWAQASARAVARVDVSADGGRSWHQAALEHEAAAPWSWTLWELALDLPAGGHELACRAWDDAGQTQPALPDDTWNFKGYLSAAWHRVRVDVR